MIYFVSFVISIFIAYKLDDAIENNKKYKHLIICAILLPVLLAALRHHSIGIDVDTYVVPSWKYASISSSLRSFLGKYEAGEIDYGYVILCYIGTKFYDSMSSTLSLTQLFTLLPIMLTFVYVKKQDPMNFKIWFAYFVYLFSFYNVSLCVIRQFLAIGLAVYSWTWFDRRKYIPFILLAILAWSFHQTVLVFFALLFIFFLLGNRYDLFKKKALMLMFSFFVALFFAWRLIIPYISMFAMALDEKYATRMDGNERKLGTLYTIYYAFLAIYPLLMAKREHVDAKRYAFVFYFPLVGFLIFIMSSFSEYLVRLACYFQILVILTIPMCIRNKMKKGVAIVMIFIYWYYSFILKNNWETYPYIFS